MRSGDDLSEHERELLAPLGPTSRLFVEDTGYLGWRAGITPDGAWVFFVAGGLGAALGYRRTNARRSSSRLGLGGDGGGATKRPRRAASSSSSEMTARARPLSSQTLKRTSRSGR